MIYGVVFLQSIVLFRLFEFLFCFVVLLLWFMLLFSIRCCSPVFGINPIEFACIIMWAVRWERRGSNSLTILYVCMYIYIYVLQTFQSRSQTTNWSKGANHSFEQVAMPLSQAIGGWAIVYFFNVTRFGLADLGTLLTLPIFRHPGQAAFSHLPQTEIVVLFLRCCMYIYIYVYVHIYTICVCVGNAI